MRTDSNTGPEAEPAPHGRLLAARNAAFVRTRWFPLVACLAALAATMLVEAMIHVVFFGADSFVEALVTPDPHELWMRLVITGFATAIAMSWYLSAREHAAYEKRLEVYQDRLRELTAQISHGQHEAYRGLGRRLHENVAQSLSAGSMFLSAGVGDGGPLDPEIARSVTRIIDRAIADCREIAQELAPPALDTYGLIPALETYADRVMVRSGVSIEVEPSESPALSEPLLLASYYAIAEIVSAAAANPDTRTIRVESHRDQSAVVVTIQWDAEEVDDLLGSREKLCVFGADMRREVLDGHTTVTVSAPLSPAA